MLNVLIYLDYFVSFNMEFIIMHAITNDGKIYVMILELHKNITDTNVRDSIPEFRIATHERTDHINWEWILGHGFMPLVKSSPTILRHTMQEYIFTPEFWTCSCDSEFLHIQHFSCIKCEDNVIINIKDSLKSTPDLWGDGPFSSIEQVVLEGMLIEQKIKNKIKDSPLINIYKHLKAFDFKWDKAFSIEQF